MTATTSQGSSGEHLTRFVSRLALNWERDVAEAPCQDLEGSLAFFDISGFTRLSERLSNEAKLGVESITEVVDSIFANLVSLATSHGGDVLQFSGDAILVLFDGEHHTHRAATAALAMQKAMRDHGRVETPKGVVRLAMSAGMESGTPQFLRFGGEQQVVLAVGDVSDATCALEKYARPGEVLLGPTASARLGAAARGQQLATGFSLRGLDDKHRPDSHDLFGAESRAATTTSEHSSVFVQRALRSVLNTEHVASDHRPVSVGFLGTRGLHTMLCDHGPDHTAMQLHAVASALEFAQREYEITWLGVDALQGEADFFCCSGAPAMHENDEDRLLLGMRHVMDACPDVGLAGGANSGRAFAAVIGSAARRSFSVTGDSTNVAARVMARAQVGELLATKTMLANCRERFEIGPYQSFVAKGKRAAIAAAAVKRRLAIETTSSASETAFFGRDTELAAITATFDEARRGRGCVIDVHGDAGSGKSRLMDAVRGEAHAMAIVDLRGETFRANAPYGAWTRPLRQLAGIPGDATAVVAGEQLAQFCLALDPEPSPYLPLLAIPFAASVPPTPATDALAPEFVAGRLHSIVWNFLSVTLLGPAVFIAEDLHWFDRASHALVEFLAGHASESPWIVCATRRSHVPPLLCETGRSPLSFDLNSMNEDAIAQLIVAERGARGIDDDALVQIIRRSAGNALFARSLAAMPDTDDIPESVERLIGTKIDALAPIPRALLREASVLGTNVDLALLDELLDENQVTTANAWNALSEFILVGDERVEFRHDLFRLTAYSGLPFRRRRELHARVADALLDQAVGTDLDLAAPILAYHYARSDRHADAWEWSVRAAERSRASAAVGDAVTLYAQAFEAAKQIRTLAPQVLATVAEAMGDTAEKAGQVDRARDAYRTARRHCRDDALSSARLLRKHGYIAEKAGAYVMSLRWYGRAASLLGTLAGDLQATLEAAHVALGIAGTRVHQGQLASARRSIERVLPSATAAGDTDVLAQAYLLLEIIAAESGDSQRAAYEALALRYAHELGDQRRLGSLLLNCGLSAANESRWDDAAAHYRTAERCYLAVGHVVGRALVANNRSEVLTDQGHYDEANVLLHDSRRAFRAANYAVGIALTTSGLSRIAVRANEFIEAHKLLDEAEAQFRAIGADAYIADTLVRQVECLVWEGRSDEALEAATHADALLSRSGHHAGLELAVLRYRSLAHAQLGDVPVALEILAAALAQARDIEAWFEVAACLETSRYISGEMSGNEMSERDAITRRLGIAVLPVPQAHTASP